MSQGIIFDIAEASIHDGPGLRTTVFLKGCPLRCRWCHSPEGQEFAPQELRAPGVTRTVGECWSDAELAAYLNTLAPLLRPGGGGVTFSGGEPLAQADFVLDVLARLENMHSVLDTSGFGDGAKLVRLAAHVSLVHWGLKIAVGDEAARYWTKVPWQPVRANLEQVTRETATPVVFRIPLLAGVTDTPENLAAIADLTRLPHVARVEFLPSNAQAGAKYPACGRHWEPGFDEKAPSTLDVAAFGRACAVPVYVLDDRRLSGSVK